MSVSMQRLQYYGYRREAVQDLRQLLTAADLTIPSSSHSLSVYQRALYSNSQPIATTLWNFTMVGKTARSGTKGVNAFDPPTSLPLPLRLPHLELSPTPRSVNLRIAYRMRQSL